MYTSTDNYDLMWEAAKSSFSDHVVLTFIWKLLFLEHFITIKYEKENFSALQCMICIFFYLKRG